MLVLCLHGFRLTAQGNFDIPVAFAGEVRAASGTLLQVDLLWVDTTDAQIDAETGIGAFISVEGLLRIDGTIVASVITAYTPPVNVTAVVGTIPTAQPTLAPASMIIVGPVQAINATNIIIYGIEIQLDPAVPLPRVNEMVRVTAEQVDGVIIARTITQD
jgi:hypothetical protein